MKKILIFFLSLLSSQFLLSQIPNELPQNHFVADVLDFGGLCGYDNSVSKNFMHINRDSVIFEMYCDRAYGGSTSFITLIDVQKNKLLNSRKVSDSYKDVLGGYIVRNNRLIKIKTGKTNTDGDDISVLEIDIHSLEIKEIFNTNTFFPNGLKGIELFNARVDIEYLFDSNVLLGSFSKPEERKVKRNGSTYIEKVWISTAFLIDCNNKKIKKIDNCFFSFQPGTIHPYKFFDKEKNGDVSIAECKTYQIPNFSKMSLGSDINYDNAAFKEIKQTEKPVFLQSNVSKNIAYVIEEGTNGSPLVYYAMRKPNFSVKELRQQLNAYRSLIQNGKTRYKPLVNSLLLEYNRKKEYPLFYLPEENKFLCRDSSSKLIEVVMPDVVQDLGKSNQTIKEYNALSVKSFRRELRPNYKIVALERKESLAGKENTSRIKAFTYKSTSFRNIVLVYSEFIAFTDTTGYYFSPIKNCKAAFLIGKDSLVLANDVRCILISLAKKSILMDIDLEKINSSYTPYCLNLSGGGKYLAIYNNMLNFSTIIQLFPFKILENIPALENISSIAVSENGEKVMIEHKLKNTTEVLQFNRRTNESKMLDISLDYYTDDLSHIFFNRGTGRLLVYSTVENVTKGFVVFPGIQNYNRVFKLSSDKFLLNDGQVLSWTDGIAYTPNFDIGDKKISTTGYDPINLSLLTHEDERLGICTKYELENNYTTIVFGKNKINLIPSDEAVFITKQRNEAWKKKYEEERKLREELAKNKEAFDALKSEMVCDACFGEPINKTGKCSYNRCRNGYVYGETNTMRYDDKGYVEYKNTKTTEKCYLCKGTGYWVCEKCEGTGLAKKKRGR